MKGLLEKIEQVLPKVNGAPPFHLEQVWTIEGESEWHDLLNAIKSHDELVIFDGRVHVAGGEGWGLNHIQLARWLLKRSVEASSESAIRELSEYCSLTEYECASIDLLCNIWVDKNVPGKKYMFANGVEIIDLSLLDDSFLKKSLEREADVNSFTGGIQGVLRKKVKLKPSITQPGDEISLNRADFTPDFEAVCYALTLATDYGYGSWGNTTALPDCIPQSKMNIMWYESRLTPGSSPYRRTNTVGLSDLKNADKLLQKMIDLTADDLALVLQQIRWLNSARISVDLAQQAISLRTCMETIFIPKRIKNITKTLSLRASEYMYAQGVDRNNAFAKIKAFYEFSSSCVHKGYPVLESDEFVDAGEANWFGMELCKGAIVKRLEEGIPAWNKV